MGFFSWTCAKTQKPILAGVFNDWFAQFSKVVIIRRDKKAIKGTYDGYGSVELASGKVIDIAERIGPKFKLVLAAFYDGETIDQLGENEHARNQGYFWSWEMLSEVFGTPPAKEQREHEMALKFDQVFKALGEQERWGGLEVSVMDGLIIVHGEAGTVAALEHSGRRIGAGIDTLENKPLDLEKATLLKATVDAILAQVWLEVYGEPCTFECKINS